MAALWDGKEVLFIGGTGSGTRSALRGMAYNPATNHWRRLPAMQFRRNGFAAVWTGRQMIVWGGYVPSKNTARTFLDGAAFTRRTP